ncbi:MAG TPA: shikimate kinase [Pyrinomonadaceae bacterium]|nr:shikimate kinase [Pyrinomonadaceae bacterium]
MGIQEAGAGNRRGRPVVITGFMGAGKTTVAAALAERLGCTLIDLDRFVAGREGRTAQMIIDADGEPRFREIESEALRDALNTDAGVIALGGGTWTIERNRELIAERGGLTVWLDAPFELCWRRIESAKHTRPLARDPARARALYDARRADYGRASLRLNVDDRMSARAIAEEIGRALGLWTREGHD